MFCKKCGADARDAKYCPNCGSAINEEITTPSVETRKVEAAVTLHEKSAGLALFLSFLIPGIGEMYVGRVKRGVALLLLAILSAAVLSWIIVGLITYPIIWIYSMVDSYKLAKLYNSQLIENNGNPPW